MTIKEAFNTGTPHGFIPKVVTHIPETRQSAVCVLQKSSGSPPLSPKNDKSLRYSNTVFTHAGHSIFFFRAGRRAGVTPDFSFGLLSSFNTTFNDSACPNLFNCSSGYSQEPAHSAQQPNHTSQTAFALPATPTHKSLIHSHSPETS
jgi:hypothetical protein